MFCCLVEHLCYLSTCFMNVRTRYAGCIDRVQWPTKKLDQALNRKRFSAPGRPFQNDRRRLLDAEIPISICVLHDIDNVLIEECFEHFPTRKPEPRTVRDFAFLTGGGAVIRL